MLRTDMRLLESSRRSLGIPSPGLWDPARASFPTNLSGTSTSLDAKACPAHSGDSPNGA